MSFSKESRYRNITAPSPYYQPRTGRRIPPGYLIIGAIAVILILCCCCASLAVLFLGPGGSFVSSLGGPSPTPTIDKNAPVPLKTKAVMDNGLELTVTSVERPLKVEGNINLPSDQQFILVSVRIRNTKKTGSPIHVTAGDFKVKGDGGLTYDANPKTVTIPQEITQVDIPSGGSLDGELIFQIAYNDSGLKMAWTTGNETRVFSLNTQQ